jgi:hypothetical protein
MFVNEKNAKKELILKKGKKVEKSDRIQDSRQAGYRSEVSAFLTKNFPKSEQYLEIAINVNFV